MLGALLPTASGFLPKWQFFVAATALFNSVQNLFGTTLTKQVYAGKPAEVTGLQARTFASWTLVSAIVRLYGAYYIHEKAVYELAMWTYAVAMLHFVSEWLVFGSAKLSRGLIGPLIIAPLSLTWMVAQYDHYVQN